jgi:hypothetical protein
VELQELLRSRASGFASKRSKTLSWRLLNSIEREEFKHRCLKLADPTNRRTKLSKHVKKRGAPFPHRKTLRRENGRIWHSIRLSVPWTDSLPHPQIANQIAEGNQFNVNL